MEPETRKRLEEVGYAFGDFADFLGLDDIERKMIEIRADLGSAIRRIREERGDSRAKFARMIGASQRELGRIEIAAPEISLDLMLMVYFKAGGAVRYEFASPVVPAPAEGAKPAGKPVRSVRPRKVAKALKA
jgi:DNA-binding XRE family transcriptional regulator